MSAEKTISMRARLVMVGIAAESHWRKSSLQSSGTRYH